MRHVIINLRLELISYTHISGSTLEEISAMVEQIGREFRSKQAQLQPLLAELKVFHYIHTFMHTYIHAEFVLLVFD